jgi:hypothetical protein
MTLLSILIGLALIATITSLVWGVGSMAFGGSFDDKHSAHFMTARVGFQALVVILLIIASLIAL